MAEAVQTIPRVFLGEALKQLRADSGKTLDDAAKAAGKDRARLIKVLEGKATLTADELDAGDILPGFRTLVGPLFPPVEPG